MKNILTKLKKILPIILLVISSVMVSAQTTVSILPNQTACVGDIIQVPITLTGTNVLNMQFLITYDPAILALSPTAPASLVPGMSVTGYNPNYTANTLFIAIDATGFIGFNFDNQKIVNLEFTVLDAGTVEMHIWRSPDPTPPPWSKLWNNVGTVIPVNTWEDNTITTYTVLPASVSIVSNPVMPICPGSLVTFTATAVNGGLAPTFKWYRNDIEIVGETNPTLATDEHLRNDQFKCVMTSSYTCASGSPATSNVITISYPYTDLVAGAVTASQTICSGTAPAPLQASAASGGNPPYSYLWQNSVNGIDFSDIDGATSATGYEVPVLYSNEYFRQQVSYTGICGTVTATTNSVLITVNPIPTVDPVDNQVVCNGEITNVISFTGLVPGTVFNWVNSNPGIGLAASGTGPINAFTAINVGTVPVIANITVTPTFTYNGVTCTGTPIYFTYTVNPTPSVTPISDQAHCFGATVPETPVTGTVVGTVYNWTNSNTDIGLAPSGTGDIPGFIAENPTNVPIVATITITPTANGCTGPIVTYTITVYPEFHVGSISENQNICYNTSPLPLSGVAPTGGNTPYSYQWQSSTNNINFSNIVGATNLNYAPGTLTQTTYYQQIQTSASGCGTLTTNKVTINVYSPFVVGSIAEDQSICYSTTPDPLTGTAPTGGNTPYSYQWQSSTNNINFSNIVGATNLNYAPGTLTQTTYYQQIQTSASGCGSLTTNKVTITVNPLPLVSAVTLEYSTTGTSPWMPVNGTLGTGYNLCIDIDIPFYYLDINTLSVNVPLASTGFVQNGFKLNTASLPPTWTSYWNAKGVNASAAPGTWQAVMYQIILGNQPMYYINYTGTDYQLIDGMQYQLNGTIATLRVSGDYPQWSYGYSGTVTDINGCVSNPMNIQMTFNTIPEPTITGPITACMNSTGNIYTTEAGMTGYTWVVVGGTIVGSSTGNSINVTWTTVGAQSVSVNYTAPNGCTEAVPTVLPVTVKPLPVPTLTGPVSVCVNSTGNIYTTEAGMTNYVWTVSTGGTITAGGTSTDNTITVTWNTTGAQSVSVSYSDAGGCAGTPKLLAVTVNPLPVPTLTGPVSVCVNSIGNIYTTETGMTNYVWTVSAGGTITAGGTPNDNTVTITWGTVGAQTVSVSYTNAGGCTAAAAKVLPVTVNALPVPTITGPTSACVNSTGNIYTTETGMTGYAWVVVGGTIVGSSTGNSINVTWTTVGAQSVSVTYTDGNGCAAVAPTVLPVTVNPLPVPTITGPATACLSSTGNVYTTEVGMTGYTWTVVGGTITAGTGTNAVTVTWNSVGAQSISVNYTNANGCMAASATVKAVTVFALPSPTITGLNTICAGTTGVSYQTEPGMTNYVWTISAGGTITSGAGTNAVLVSWNSGGAQTISVNYNNLNGCAALLPTVYNVSVHAQPVPTITGPNSVCVNSTTNVYNTEAGMTNYVWAVSAGGTITAGSTTNAITVTWGTTGAKTVSVNYSNANNCTASTPTVYNVTVNPLPVPTISGNASVCKGITNVVYTTQSGMTNYIWTVSAGGTITAGGTPTSNSITITWHTAGVQAVTVNYTNANGCTAAAPVSFAVTVNPTPTPVIGSNNDPCVNSIGNYYTESGMSGYVWTVSAGGTIVSGQGTNAINVLWNAPGTQWVSVNYNNSFGCPGPVATVYNLFVTPLPNAAGPISGTNAVCAGTNGVSYSTTPVMNALTYTWTLPAGATIASGAGTTNITVNFGTAAVSGNITVSGTNGCGNGEASTFAVTVNPLPAAAGTITGAASVCEGTSNVTYTVPAIANATGYQWTVPAGATITSGANTNSIKVTFTTAGTGVITVKGTNTCGNGAVSPNFNVTVNAIPPAPVITANGNLLTSSSPTGNQWYYEGNPIPGATGQTYTVLNNTGYYWCVVTINGCSSEISNKLWVEVVGYNEKDIEASISIYPVPNNGVFNVSINSPVEENYTILVYNQLGSKIFELGDNKTLGGKFETLIDLGAVSSGVYSVVFMNDNHKIVKKILIRK